MAGAHRHRCCYLLAEPGALCLACIAATAVSESTFRQADLRLVLHGTDNDMIGVAEQRVDSVTRDVARVTSDAPRRGDRENQG
jgi:hypothetical protein